MLFKTLITKNHNKTKNKLKLAEVPSQINLQLNITIASLYHTTETNSFLQTPLHIKGNECLRKHND